MAGMDLETTMDVVLKNIYTSCDPEETNQVPCGKLIEFISPYLMQDVIAFESLKSDLDPENKNVLISSERFFEIMNKWAKKIACSNDGSEDGFNCTPSQLDEIDDKDLPFVQSTPRASFGQKLLSCEELLNLSNLNAADLAATANTNDESTVGQNRQFLEEEVKRLEHQLKQAFAEMDMMKGQITTTEEQNEHLQLELNRYRTRLVNEQQINDHLQKDKANNEELKEELSARKKDLENLSKKLHQYEKDTNYMSTFIKQLEHENTRLTERCEEMSAREQKLKKENYDMKTDLEVKEQELLMISKLNEELKQKLSEEKQIIEDLTQENDLLDYKKTSLERRLSTRRFSSFSPCPSNKRSLSTQGSAISPSITNEDAFLFNSPSAIKRLGSPISPCLDSPLFSKSQTPFRFPKRSSLNPKKISNVQDHSYDEDSFELPTESDRTSNQQVSLHAELFQTGQFGTCHKEDNNDEEWNSDELINSLSVENETLKEQMSILSNENETLQIQIKQANTKLEELFQDLKRMEADKEERDKTIECLQDEKRDLESRIRNMEIRYPELLTKNHNKIQELEDNLLKIRKDYSNLQTQCKTQENELTEYKNKFNFEIPFKNLQIELNQKNKELEELNQSCQNYKSLIQKITKTNLELTQSLSRTKQSLEEYAVHTKQIEKRSENNQQVKTQLENKTQSVNELIATKNSNEEKINHLEMVLKEKLLEIESLKEMQVKDMTIRNTMWKNYRELKITTDSLKDKLVVTERSIKELKEEHNKLLAVYNDEVTKNCELCEQINKQKEELYKALTKYEEANEKNARLSEQVELLKRESGEMKQNQTICNRKISEKLSEYQDMIRKYDEKMKELEKNNNSLKFELQLDKNDFGKITEYEAVLELKEKTIRELELSNYSLRTELEQQKTLFDEKSFENITTKYETILEEKEKVIKELEVYTDSLKTDLDQKKQQCDNYVDKITQYEAILEKNEKTIKELEFANSALNIDFEIDRNFISNNNFEKISEYEKFLEEKEKTIKELELENYSLKAELEQEKRLVDKKESDDSSVDSFSLSFQAEKHSEPKTRSFDKQQLIIEKLRLRVSNLELELQREKSKNETLNNQKDEINEQVQQIKEKYEQLLNDYSLEKQTSTNRIDDLLNKNKAHEEHFNIMKNTFEEKIQNLACSLSQIQEFHLNSKLELESKDSLLKQQLEIIENNLIANQKLYKTIEELNMKVSNKEIALKSYISENSNFKNLCDNSEKKLQELSLKVIELEREVNCRREEVKLLSNCVLEKENTIQDLKTRVTELDSKFADVCLELSEKENQYAQLLEEKENLQDKLSKTDDRKEMELMDLEEKIGKSRILLQCLQAQIGITRRLSDNSLEGNSSSKKILVDADVVVNSNRELLRALSMALKNWQKVLKNDARFRCIPSLEEENSPEESFCSLSEKIMVTVMLLEILATKAPMENSGNSPEVLGISTEINNRTVKKFTLRPSKLVVGRPISPDSPSVGIEKECGDISISSKVLDSPDSRTVEVDNSFNNTRDDALDECTANASQLFSPLGLLFDDAFPHLTDSFLEKIGLHEDGSKQVLSVPETERVFATFAIQIALDSTDIKERLGKQKEECEKQHRRLLHLMKDISVRLREHKCIGALDSIKPVFVLLEDVRYLLREIMQTSGQFGILSCEHRMMRCWNMVTNYMAILKKEASLSPSKRRQILLDKGVCTNNLQEGLKNFVGQSIETYQKRLSEEVLGQNDPDFTDDVGHRYNGFFAQCKRLTKWLVFLIFFVILGLVSIHWQCQMSTESQVCPLDAFIKKINVGTPPY